MLRNTVYDSMVIVSIVALMLSVGTAQGKKTTLTGHLVDQMCRGEVKDAAKAAEHSKECALIGSLCVQRFCIFSRTAST